MVGGFHSESLGKKRLRSLSSRSTVSKSTKTPKGAMFFGWFYDNKKPPKNIPLGVLVYDEFFIRTSWMADLTPEAL